ncbi:hypothetical protein B0J11DRAFT_79303 [Dendryphion nanum]|uniref:Uncharacterized protein n=1 Tax=Dendryphion nanum TaxID=256645 RepID=A0A9P9IGV5_9PLEO|nr:hypothetical protein B0J11DRAFT_79303 [Dendryphion nanum]
MIIVRSIAACLELYMLNLLEPFPRASSAFASCCASPRSSSASSSSFSSPFSPPSCLLRPPPFPSAAPPRLSPLGPQPSFPHERPFPCIRTSCRDREGPTVHSFRCRARLTPLHPSSPTPRQRPPHQPPIRTYLPTALSIHTLPPPGTLREFSLCFTVFTHLLTHSSPPPPLPSFSPTPTRIDPCVSWLLALSDLEAYPMVTLVCN